jgi:predicted RNase H-like nuclease
MTLSTSPVLESWNARDHPELLRLRQFLDHVGELVTVSDDDQHLALDLRIGLPESTSLTSGGGDVDNYLFPIARRLGAARFDAVFGCKGHGAVFTLAIGEAELTAPTRSPDMRVRTMLGQHESMEGAGSQRLCCFCAA